MELDSDRPASRPMGRRWRIAAAAVTAGAVIVVAGVTIRLPAYSAGPGPARDVGKLIGVTGQRTYPSRGAFLLTTVAVSDHTITLFEAVQAWLDPAVSVVPRDAIVREGLSDEQQELVNRHDMEESKAAAEVVALRALGYRVTQLDGARVVTIVQGAPADGVLAPGDVILSVDGVRVRDVEVASERLRRRRIGDAVTIRFLRDGRGRTVTIRAVESFLERGRPSVGATLGKGFRLPFDVTIETQDIGGPSGGLVFALAVADALTPEDLTGGRRIAATGTISHDGAVGAIGGLSEKVLAAERSKADIFLVPAAEAAEARRAASSIRVIGVRTLEEALRALRRLARAA